MFTTTEKMNGLHVTTRLSEEAQKFYSNTSPLTIYEDADKKYYIRGCYGNYDNLSFEELDTILTGWYYELLEEC